MNRADRLSAEGEGRRGNRVGFAVTVLQRRLASSPEAIYQSLVRRRARLEERRGAAFNAATSTAFLTDPGPADTLDPEDFDDYEAAEREHLPLLIRPLRRPQSGMGPSSGPSAASTGRVGPGRSTTPTGGRASATTPHCAPWETDGSRSPMARPRSPRTGPGIALQVGAAGDVLAFAGRRPASDAQFVSLVPARRFESVESI
jgi:hypothetical protein